MLNETGGSGLEPLICRRERKSRKPGQIKHCVRLDYLRPEAHLLLLIQSIPFLIKFEGVDLREYMLNLPTPGRYRVTNSTKHRSDFVLCGCTEMKWDETWRKKSYFDSVSTREAIFWVLFILACHYKSYCGLCGFGFPEGRMQRDKRKTKRNETLHKVNCLFSHLGTKKEVGTETKKTDKNPSTSPNSHFWFDSKTKPKLT